MRSRTAWVLLLVLVATLASAAQVKEEEPPREGTDLESSNCYRCHGSGFGMGLSSMFTVDAKSTPLALNEPVRLTVTLHNDWVAQLRDLSARIDLMDAPDMGFSGRPPPVLGVTGWGNLTFDPTDPLHVTRERTERVELPLPAGATAFGIRLVPEIRSGDEAPDLELRLWSPGSDTRGPPTRVLDAASKGGVEVFRVPDTMGGLRSGTWLAEAAQAACTDDLDPSCLRIQPFRVVGDAWFNITGGARTQTVPFPVPQLDGQDQGAPQTTQVDWTLFLRDHTQGQESLRITVNATGHYKHDPDSARYDDWPYSRVLIIPLRFDENGGGMELPAPSAVVPMPARMGWTGVDWGEVVGYVAAFTLAVGMVSGGVFGRASKRALDGVFRSARRRVAFHNLFSYGIIAFSLAHAGVFLVEVQYHWGAGLLWGGTATLGMLLLGVSGALQVPMIHWWGYTSWRVLHSGAGYVTVLVVLVHIGLDGAHFSWIAETVDWDDPVLSYFKN